jgi:DMSO/TMAO reductase YedYZ molybdopterin-dependent catalytic subunit
MKNLLITSGLTIFIIFVVLSGCVENTNNNNQQPGPIILTLVGNTTKNLTMNDLLNFESFTASGSKIKSTGTITGPYTYKGVNVSLLVSLVNPETNYSLFVRASDGYQMTYSASQVEGTFAVYDAQGNPSMGTNLALMLAYEQIGENLTDGPRIVIVGKNSPTTDSHFWVKNVSYMKIMPFTIDWSVNLSGVTSMDMDRATFESLASCSFHKTSYKFTNETGEHTYDGVSLWVLVSAVDGADAPDGHYMFNDQLAKDGYTVRVTATDGFNVTFLSSQITGNNSILVAYQLDNNPLPSSEFPLRIIGNNLTGKQKIKMIASIKLEGFQLISQWNLTVKGIKTLVFDQPSFIAAFSCGTHTRYYNYTDDSGPHSYAGIPLWIFVGAVDDNETGHNTLNMTLVNQGYNVTVFANDGYNQTFPISMIAQNDSIIVAYTFDGKTLTGENAPLKLVGSGLSNKQKIKGVSEIRLQGL